MTVSPTARQQLRQQLLDLVDPCTVHWGCEFDSYSHTPAADVGQGGASGAEGGVRLRFKRGSEPVVAAVLVANAGAVVLLYLPLPFVDVSAVQERGCQHFNSTGMS